MTQIMNGRPPMSCIYILSDDRIQNGLVNFFECLHGTKDWPRLSTLPLANLSSHWTHLSNHDLMPPLKSGSALVEVSLGSPSVIAFEACNVLITVPV
jgi:hypothetical protein